MAAGLPAQQRPAIDNAVNNARVRIYLSSSRHSRSLRRRHSHLEEEEDPEGGGRRESATTARRPSQLTMAAVDQPPPPHEDGGDGDDGTLISPPPHPPSATQLEFTQAMQDFKTMFPEMDVDVIEAVLRSNQGAVDATIDQLLTMSTDNENEKLRTEMDAADNAESPPSYSPTTPPPSYQQAVPGLGGTATGSPWSSYPQAVSSNDGTATPPPSPKTTVDAPPSTGGGGGDAVVDLLTFSPTDEDSFDALDPLAIEETPVVIPPLASLSMALGSSEGAVAGAAIAGAASASSPQKEPEALRTSRNWCPPLLRPLPVDFLRLDSMVVDRKSRQHREVTTVLSSEIIQRKIEENARQQRRLSGGDGDPELVRYLEDERIALLLQNEEFVQELRRNKDFMSTLERDALSKQQNYSYSVSDSETDTEDEVDKLPGEMLGLHPYTKPFPSEDTDAAFREKLKNMGKMSRRKFAQLARIFSRRKKRSAKQILSEGSVPSQDHLLLEDDDDLDESGDEMSTKNVKDDHLEGKHALPNSYERPAV